MRPRKRIFQRYRPDCSVKFSPRVQPRLLKAVNRICIRYDMPETDVMRYSFEAVVPMVIAGKLPFKQSSRIYLDAMITVRTSRRIADMTRILFHRLRAESIEPKKPHNPQQMAVEHADVLRGLIEMAVAIAADRGMAHIMALREKALKISR